MVEGLLSTGPTPSSLLPTAVPVYVCLAVGHTVRYITMALQFSIIQNVLFHIVIHLHFCLTMAASADNNTWRSEHNTIIYEISCINPKINTLLTPIFDLTYVIGMSYFIYLDQSPFSNWPFCELSVYLLSQSKTHLSNNHSGFKIT